MFEETFRLAGEDFHAERWRTSRRRSTTSSSRPEPADNQDDGGNGFSTDGKNLASSLPSPRLN